MADAPKILGTDTLRSAYPKLNSAIDNANTALTTAGTAKSTADTAKSTADTALSNSENTQTQLDTIVINGDSSVEAAQARVKSDGTTFTTLQQRLNESDAQLAEKVKKADWYVNVKDYGAKGDGVTDDTVAIQNAVNACAGGGTCYFPDGVYLISQTIVLPKIAYGGTNFIFVTLKGSKPTLTEKGGLLAHSYGSIIKTTNKSVTAFKSPVKEITNPYALGWSRELSIMDLAIIGTQGITDNWNDPLVTDKNSCGLDFDGIMNVYTNNLHVEGFGTGIKLNDGFIDFTGSTNVKHCYKGVSLSRTDSGKDLIAIFDNLRSNSNKINMELNNARIVILKSGTFATADAHNELGVPNVIIKNSSELDLHIHDFTLESNRVSDSEAIPLIDVDASGINILSIKDCNITSLLNTILLRVKGFFGSISIKDNIFHENVISYDGNTTLSLTHPMLHIAFNSGENSKEMGMSLNIEGNDPEFLQGFVRNDYSADPAFDHMPRGYKVRNGIPENDKRIINVNNPIGTNFSFSVNNVLVGNARMYWNADDTGLTTNILDVHLTDSRGKNPLKEDLVFFVSVIVNDNGGTKIPIVYHMVNALGQIKSIYSGGYFAQNACKIKEFTVNGITFSKYVISVTIKKPKDVFFNSGIKNIRLSNIFGGNEYTGIEYLAVYTKSAINKQFPYYATEKPVSGFGYFNKSDVIYNSNPIAGGYVGWVCISDGLSSSANWKGFGLIEV